MIQDTIGYDKQRWRGWSKVGGRSNRPILEQLIPSYTAAVVIVECPKAAEDRRHWSTIVIDPRNGKGKMYIFT